jgi:hypothetical protein
LARVQWRRDEAMNHLSELKSHAVALCLAVVGDVAPIEMQSGAEVIKKQVFVVLDDAHR